MKTIFRRVAAATLCVYLLTVSVLAKELIPVGKIVGLELQDNRVAVAGFDEKEGAAAKASGLCSGDIIEKIDGMRITCAEDIRTALQKSDGEITVQICRNGTTSLLQIKPAITQNGPKLGIYLRQGISGIGTVTWYDPETKKFGTLGHGVNDSGGKLLTMARGNVYYAKVANVKKGEIGEPGQLYGAITDPEPAGTLYSNTQQGVFGVCENGWEGQAIPLAKASEVKTGNAVIRANVSGETVREYSVKILKIYPQSRSGGRNLLIKVTDPDLLAATGGIVQGMSGSPIIQDGKLVGAVTHVLVNDPTTGYGIFIQNMLEAAG